MVSFLKSNPGFWWVAGIIALLALGSLMGQQQVSGGGIVKIDQSAPGTSNGVSLTNINATATATGNGVAGPGVLRVAVSSDNAALPVNATISAGLPASPNMIGYVKQRPAGCTAAGTSDVVHDVVGVATGAGSSVSAVTGCILECFVNNPTNSAVTLRLADKAGTPVIWVGGGADFSVQPNSNMGCGGNGGLLISGISFTSGITAIAGTAAALNLHLVTRE